MVDVHNARCQHPGGCDRRPGYALPDTGKAIMCREHKTDQMVDITHSKCLHEGCEKAPSFGNPGEKKRMYCKEHKSENMVDTRANSTKKARKCERPDCNKWPHYGLQTDRRRRFCSEHKLEDMVNLDYRSKKKRSIATMDEDVTRTKVDGW